MTITPGKEMIVDFTGIGGMPIFFITILTFWFLDVKEWAIKFFIGIVLCYFIAIIIRLLYFKRRPDGSVVRKSPWYLFALDRWGQSSFPSLHTMRVTTLGILLAFFFGNPYTYAFFMLIIIGVAWTRILLQRHYLIDTVFGLMFGILVSAIVLWLPLTGL